MRTFNPILENEEHTVNNKLTIPSKDHPASPQLSNNRKYGSFATAITESNTWSSSSQQSSTADDAFVNSNMCNKLSVDQNHQPSPGHSRESSYSDISSDGYYDRYARREWLAQRNQVCAFIENSLMTMHNFKVILSALLWFICYMVMGLFGGTVAYLHFQRTDSDVPQPLPDFGYDAIPYYCPNIPHIPHSNVQSVVLFILYIIIICGVIYRWRPRHHPKCGMVIWGGDGRLILQHLFHLNCLVFLTRTTTVGLTGLPQPNPKCVTQQHFAVSFSNALSFVMGRGFPPHSCGDLIYSGHVGCTLICMAVLHRHGFLRNRIAAILTWAVAVIGIYFTISCRSHYSVDVVLAFYFGYFLPEWYFNRSDGRVRGRVSRWIKWLEVRPSDLKIDYSDGEDVKEEYLLTISV